jgi:murein DD-endopeptidase MepM/ murein hydrolase activator NlpD
VKRSLIVGAMLLGLSAAPSRPVAQNLGVTAAPGSPLGALSSAQAEIVRLSNELTGIDTDASTLTPERAALRARARQQARWLYHLSQGDALALRGGPEMMLDHAARAGRVRRVFHTTLKAMQRADQRAEVLDLDRQRVARLLQVAQEQRTRAEAEQRAQAAALGVYGALPSGTAPPSVTVYGGAASITPGVERFAESAGRLLFPVAGRAEVRRAFREGAEGPGLEVSVPLGTPARAVFPGRVAFADRYGAYGMIVIVDHGDHYYSVSANLARIDVRVGQELSTGDLIGSAGDDGRGPMLYFEVRHAGETVDPVPWLGL